MSIRSSRTIGGASGIGALHWMNTLRKRDLLLSLKYATIEASFSVPMLNLTLTQFPFAVGFAVTALGWSSGAIGWLAAIPHLCNALQPPLTYLLRKRLSLYQIMVDRKSTRLNSSHEW